VSNVARILYFLDSHFINLRAWLISRSNNFVEPMALEILLSLSSVRHILNSIFWWWINWMNYICQLYDFSLITLEDDCFLFFFHFTILTFIEVADKLSKEGIHITKGFWEVKECRKGVLTSSLGRFCLDYY
jgi:hypothetical protein